MEIDKAGIGRVFAISDLHVDYKENLQFVR